MMKPCPTTTNFPPSSLTDSDSHPSEDEEEYISDTTDTASLTSKEADSYDHSHPAEIGSSCNDVEATFGNGDLNGAALATPLAASGSITNPQGWHTLLDRSLHE